jgi:hypothetical protein
MADLMKALSDATYGNENKAKALDGLTNSIDLILNDVGKLLKESQKLRESGRLDSSGVILDVVDQQLKTVKRLQDVRNRVAGLG